MQKFETFIVYASCVAAGLLVSACPIQTGETEAEEPTVSVAEPVAPAAEPSLPVKEVTLADVGIDPGNLDRSAKVCEDFYQFACGGWISKTEIPVDESRWGASFSVITKQNREELKAILEEAQADPGKSRDKKQLGAYYGACMDEGAIEKTGTLELRPWLKMINRAGNAKKLAAAITELHKHQIWAVWDLSAEQDFKNATQVIGYLDQNGLGLPDRDYYTKDDERSTKVRAAYLAHVERMFKLAGIKGNRGKQAAADVMRIETALAKVSKTRVERRDPNAQYNKIDRDGVKKLVPNFDWTAYFKTLGQPELKDINVTAPKFFEGVNGLLRSEKTKAWQSYLSWHVIRTAAHTLPKAFVDEAFAMQAELSGQAEIQVRWKRCVRATDGALGEILGKAFVKRKFAGESKTSAERMVEEIAKAFYARVQTLDWMDDTTKARAVEKLQMMRLKIGYPARPKKYDFAVDRKSYAKNELASAAHEFARDLAKIGKPVDRREWHMSAPTVNAYYNPLLNEMVYPAGILQPPFYSANASVAVNMGAMGMVVGHELTHGFDDQGSQFAGDGNLKNWWEPAVGKKFKSKTQCVSDQYSKYQPLQGVAVNGELTLGENIADMGGIKLAFAAYRNMRKDRKEAIVADGFSEDQQFFLATAQAWCSKSKDQDVRQRIVTDPHSPPQFRVNGPMGNLAAFAETFGCDKGTKMNPKNTCDVW